MQIKREMSLSRKQTFFMKKIAALKIQSKVRVYLWGQLSRIMHISASEAW